MRRLLILVCIACVTMTLQAKPVYGIRINAGNSLVFVYMDGQPISLATNSCFIANLTPGYYKIEVFEATSTNPHRKGRRLFRDNVHFNGSQLKDIKVRGTEIQHRPNRPEYNRPYPNGHNRLHVMSPHVFEEYCKSIEDANFDSNRIKLVKNSVINTRFTSEQCLEILKICSFDSNRLEMAKVLYPSVVDKESFFLVKKAFGFTSYTRQLDEFIQQYHEEMFE